MNHLDLNIGKLRISFLSEHDIIFKRFECGNLDEVKETKIHYPIDMEEDWANSSKRFLHSNKKELILEGDAWMGCLCNPKNKQHKWIGYYECDSGWDLKIIMAAIRHNYLWGSVSCYFTKGEWRGDAIYDKNNSQDLWIDYPMHFENQIAEATYVSALNIEIEKDQIYISYCSYT